MAPPLPPGNYIRAIRHFRSLFHWRPTRRRRYRRHGKTGVRVGIRRHRNPDGEGLLSGHRERPILGACSFVCGALGGLSGKGRPKTWNSREAGPEKGSLSGYTKVAKGLGVCGNFRHPPHSILWEWSVFALLLKVVFSHA
jgi:hypothetical protein